MADSGKGTQGSRDFPHTRGVLPSEAAVLLQSLWGRSLARAPGMVSREDLRSTAGAVSDVALRAHLLPEQLICEVKDSWRAYDGFRDATQRHSSEWLLTEVVSLCISAFYRDAGEPGWTSEGSGIARHAARADRQQDDLTGGAR
jgi:hypothetical protein